MKKTMVMMLTFISLLFLNMQWVAAANTEGPVEMLQSIANQLIDSLKQNQASLKENPGKVYSLAYKIVVPHADLAEMSKRVLPPSVWNKATPSQRTKFEGEFTKLLVRTYASALSDYSNQTIQFFPIRGGFQGKSTVTVSSQIVRSDGPPISIIYRLLSSGSEWKLFDMTVEGVSLLESFRSQFADKLSQGSMDNLINQLVQHNAKRGSM